MEIKNLPRNDKGQIADFTANGNQYIVLNAGDPIGIKRWSVYEKLRLVLGVGKNFKDLVEVLESIELTLSGDGQLAVQRRDAILLLNSLRKSLIETSQARYSVAFYICSLFMIRKDEDITKWDERGADEKIKDWEAEGYSEQDFFLFALAGVEGFRAVFEKQRAIVRQQEADLSGFSK